MQLTVGAFGSITLGRYQSGQARPLWAQTTSGFLAHYNPAEGILGISKKAEGKEYSEVYLEPGAQIHFWAAKSESDPTPEGDIIKLCCPTMGATDLYLSNLRKLVELDAYGNELIQIDLASCSSLHTARLGSNLLGRITLPSVASLTCNVNDQKHTQGYSMDVKVEERPIWAIKPLDVEYESLVGQSMPQMD